MKITFLYLIVGLDLTFGYYHHRLYKGNDAPLTAVQQISKSSNAFGFNFFKELSNSENIFISPISISMVLGLLFTGAKNRTAEEIRLAMQYPTDVLQGFKEILETVKTPGGEEASPTEYSLDMANAMLVDTDFNILRTYKEQSREYFEAAVETISFSLHPDAAVQSVNAWVAWRTHNKISKILDEQLDPLTLLFLMNAVYFKGTWKTKFNPRFTMPDTFYNNGLVPKTVPMMRQKRKFSYGFDIDLQAHALELPYDGERIKMLLILPEKRDGLSDIEPSLSNDLLMQISSSLREVTVQVTLPRFNLEEDYDLIPVLKRMGIKSVFDPVLADLTGISSKPGLYVTKAVHKCGVEVNEEGSEAAAVAGVSAGVRTGGRSVPQFTADHPFLFFIRDYQLNLTLFIGRVTQL